MIDIEVITSFEQLRTIEKQWNDLLFASYENSVFLSYEWIKLWWRHFGDKKELFILVLKEKGQLVGIAPLMIVKCDTLLPVRVVKFIGTEPVTNINLFARTLGFGSRYGTAGRMDFILKNDNKEKLLKSIVEFLNDKKDCWDAIDLQGLCSTSDTNLILKSLLDKTSLIYKERIPGSFYYTPLTCSIDSYEKSLNKKTRKNLRKSKKMLEADGKLDFLSYDEPHDIKKILPSIIELESKSWKGDESAGLFTGNKKNKDFYLELTNEFATCKRLNLSLLTFNDKVIGYLYNFIFNGKFYEYSTAYDPEYAKYSPGMVLQWSVISKAFESDLTEIDFMMGYSAIKARFRLQEYGCIQSMIFKDKLYSKLLYFIEFKLKTVLKSAKNKWKK